MKLSDFDFDLPERLIATRPANPRTSARMLVANGNQISDRHVHDLVDLLNPGDRLVLNNTKVIPARLTGARIRRSDQGETRAKIEITLLAPLPDGSWRALAKPLKRVRVGERIWFSDELEAIVAAISSGELTLQFDKTGAVFEKAMSGTGQMPLPPYIAALRPVDRQDDHDYQTVFAKHKGAVAAPTASLHFDKNLLERLRAKGVEISFVTLHVGAGTFLPVKTDDISRHKMHAEWGEITTQAAGEISATLACGGRVIPVGTTALRLIESAATTPGHVEPWTGETDIFITPGYEFRATSGLMTNFHLPKSTLMMLVSALMGVDQTRDIYRHAISKGYRFFSYGDSSLLFSQRENDRSGSQ